MTANNEAQANIHNNASTPNIENHTRRANLRFVLFVSNEVASDIVIRNYGSPRNRAIGKV